MLVLLSHGFAWQDALANVTPKTFIGWHGAGFRLFWRWKSRPGRSRIPAELRALIREMALSNVSWCEERIANELLLKLGIRISPRTVRKYPCPNGRTDNPVAIDAGPPLFAIMRRPYWPVTSVLP
jgi:hypothetical protein